MRISYWSSDVCSSDLAGNGHDSLAGGLQAIGETEAVAVTTNLGQDQGSAGNDIITADGAGGAGNDVVSGGSYATAGGLAWAETYNRSEEHTSELQSLMRISYAVFCLKKKKKTNTTKNLSTQI